MKIKNILLINPRLNAWSPNAWVPLGLTYIASVLEQAGYTVRIIDLNIRQLRKGKLAKEVERADIVGIGGMITEYSEVLRLIEFVKSVNQDLTVILGGVLATLKAKELLETSQADFAVMGEGERTIVSLVDAIQNYSYGLAGIKGIAYKHNHEVIVTGPVEHIADLDSNPHPARHLLNMDRYIMNHFRNLGMRSFSNIRSTNLITSRGCPYSCNFCFQGMWGHKLRARSPQNIVDEMILLIRDYNINGFFFADDSFMVNKKDLFELCKLINKNQLKVVWGCNGRIDLVTMELLRTMRGAGCLSIGYGIESGNQQVLDYIGKGITLSQIREAVKWTKQAGISIIGFFLIGMLGETKETINDTLKFARELDLDFSGFTLVHPFPGTRLYDSMLEAGITPKSITELGDWTLQVNANLTQDCTDAELTNYLNKAFLEFYLKRRFGRLYFINPRLLLGQAKLLFSLRNTKHVGALIRKTVSLIKALR